MEHFDLEYKRIDHPSDKNFKEIPRNVRDIGWTRKQEQLTWLKVNESDREAPVQLLWMMHMDKLLLEAISNLFCSPFRPAAILKQLRIEFNIFKINDFKTSLQSLLPQEPTVYEHNPDYIRDKLMPGMLKYFNEHVVDRKTQKTNIALRFERLALGRDKSDRLFKSKFSSILNHP